MNNIKRIIQTGDRADLKQWLATCSDADLLASWVQLASCNVQDFRDLSLAAMLQRKLVRRV